MRTSTQGRLAHWGDIALYQKGRHTIAELIVVIFHGPSPLFSGHRHLHILLSQCKSILSELRHVL